MGESAAITPLRTSLQENKCDVSIPIFSFFFFVLVGEMSSSAHHSTCGRAKEDCMHPEASSCVQRCFTLQWMHANASSSDNLASGV